MSDLETRLDRLMRDKRDRRTAVHYAWGGGSGTLCMTTASRPPHIVYLSDEVTCKRCLHLLRAGQHKSEGES
jgi:hypothetical protein